jgi:hypothetical protein
MPLEKNKRKETKKEGKIEEIKKIKGKFQLKGIKRKKGKMCAGQGKKTSFSEREGGVICFSDRQIDQL